MGAKANFGSTKPNQYPNFFLVDSKFGERNKIACRIIKLWNNLINQSLAKLTDQLNWSNFVLMMGCTRPRNDCLFGLCSVWSALRSCFKNKPWKQQRHAQKICFWQIQTLNFFFTAKLYILNLLLLLVTKIQMCGLFMAFFLQGYKKLPFIFRYYSNSLGNIKVVNMDFTPSFKHFMY